MGRVPGSDTPGAEVRAGDAHGAEPAVPAQHADAPEPPALAPWLWLGDMSWVGDYEATARHGLTHRLQCAMTEPEAQKWMSTWGCDCGNCPPRAGPGAFWGGGAADTDGGRAGEEQDTSVRAHAGATTGNYPFEQREAREGGRNLVVGYAPLFDDTPFCSQHGEPLLVAASDFIAAARDAGGRIYVHCERGCSRSAAVVLCYLIRHEHMALVDAARLLKARRVRVSPNGALVDVLADIEAASCAERSDRDAVTAALHRQWLPDFRAGRVKLNKVDRIL